MTFSSRHDKTPVQHFRIILDETLTKISEIFTKPEFTESSVTGTVHKYSLILGYKVKNAPVSLQNRYTVLFTEQYSNSANVVASISGTLWIGTYTM